MLRKKKAVGGVRAKPHVRKFSRKAWMMGIGAAGGAFGLALLIDPLGYIRDMRIPALAEEKAEPRPLSLDLAELPTDHSRKVEGASVQVASTSAPANAAPPLDMSDLPKSKVPKGFPPPENKAAADAEKPKGPKTTRLALGFKGTDPFNEVANPQRPQQGQEGQTGYSTPQMVAMNQGQQGESSKADKFRNQQRGGSGSMFLGNKAISATPRPGYGQITPGTMIQAKLATATHSELGGSVVARVSMDVYDKATGTCLMIGRDNSEIFGKLSDSVEYGQERQQAVWKSIHTPKIHLDIGGMDATDSAGRTGIESETNRHYGRLAVAAIGATLLDVVSGYGRMAKGSGTQVNIGNSAANNVASIGNQIVQRELQVRDTLEQIIGSPVSLMVDKIIELPCLNRS